MTTYVEFTPPPNNPFQFNATLDGQQYSVVIKWNISGQRWYFNVYTLQGVLVLSRALVESPPDYDINLAYGYFVSTVIFRDTTQTFEIQP